MKPSIIFTDEFLDLMALKATKAIKTFGDAKIITFTDEETSTYEEYIFSPNNKLIAKIYGRFDAEEEEDESSSSN